MEKFGIFELLDALSAIADATEKGAEGPVPHAENDGDKPPKRTPDAAFAPPAYGSDAAQPSSGSSAYEGFLARHTSATSKVKK